MIKRYSFFLALCMLFVSCKTLEKNTFVVKKKKDISSLKSIKKEMLNLPSELKTKLEKSISSTSSISLPEYYTQNYIDSLKAELISNGNLRLKEYEGFLIKHLERNIVKDTLYLTNMYLKSPVNEGVKSYEFDIKKNDVVFYEIENLTNNKLTEISILDGGEIRFLKNNLKKNDIIKGSIKFASDNTLTLNVDNNTFLKNRGLFKTKLKIALKKVSPVSNLKVENKIDSVLVSQVFLEEVKDTIYEIVDNKNFNLGSRLDITKKYQQSFTIKIDKFDHLLGWGYWIGTTKQALETYNELAEDENPLLLFSKNELLNLKNTILLPINQNKDVSFVINNQSLDIRSANYGANFAFYKSDNFIEKNSKKAEVFIQNNSTLYDYNVSYNVIAVGLKTSKREVKKNIINLQNYIYITLSKDE